MKILNCFCWPTSLFLHLIQQYLLHVSLTEPKWSTILVKSLSPDKWASLLVIFINLGLFHSDLHSIQYALFFYQDILGHYLWSGLFLNVVSFCFFDCIGVLAINAQCCWKYVFTQCLCIVFRRACADGYGWLKWPAVYASHWECPESISDQLCEDPGTCLKPANQVQQCFCCKCNTLFKNISGCLWYLSTMEKKNNLYIIFTFCMY